MNMGYLCVTLRYRCEKCKKELTMFQDGSGACDHGCELAYSRDDVLKMMGFYYMSDLIDMEERIKRLEECIKNDNKMQNSC